MPDITCLICGKLRKVGQADIARGNGKYCSSACYHASQRTQIEFECVVCGKPGYIFPTKMGPNRGKYCSRRCCAIGRSKPDAKKANPAYECWRAMRKRCLNPATGNFKEYGGRGIKVCERWLNSFDNFLADMGERPPGTSLDRIDNNGNYEPANCRWATPKTQATNRRNSITVQYDGREISLGEYAAIRGVKYHSLHARITRCDMTPEAAADHLSDLPRA